MCTCNVYIPCLTMRSNSLISSVVGAWNGSVTSVGLYGIKFRITLRPVRTQLNELITKIIMINNAEKQVFAPQAFFCSCFPSPAPCHVVGGMVSGSVHHFSNAGDVCTL